jgi:hypothetical protein
VRNIYVYQPTARLYRYDIFIICTYVGLGTRYRLRMFNEMQYVVTGSFWTTCDRRYQKGDLATTLAPLSLAVRNCDLCYSRSKQTTTKSNVAERKQKRI